MISIIIPTLQEEKYITEAVLQFKNIKIPHEIIVSDGGSHDNTVEAAKNTGIKVVEFPKNRIQTIGANRNFGYTHTSGDLLIFMDADARLKNPEVFIKRVTERFKRDPNLVCLIPRQVIYRTVRTWLGRLIYTQINLNFFIMNNVLGQGAAMGKCLAIRRSAFEKINGFREDLPATEDMDLVARLAKVGKTRFDSKLVVFHSARRGLRLGWLKLVVIWNKDFISYLRYNKVVSTEWPAIR